MTVKDTGVGIPDEIKPKLFTPFETKAKGKGFGLAVVKRLTESLGGQLVSKAKLARVRIHYFFAFEVGEKKCLKASTKQSCFELRFPFS